jgi:hypothetical protein
MAGGANVSSRDNLKERQWMNRGEDKLLETFLVSGYDEGGRLQDASSGGKLKPAMGPWRGESLTSWRSGDRCTRTGDKLQIRKAVPLFEVYL